MRYIIFLSLFITSLLLNGQNFGSNFETELRPCSYDNTIQVRQPINWEPYQTLNGKWDGPRDSTLCLDFEVPENGFGSSLPLDQVNPNRPVFFQYKFPQGMPFIESNGIYTTTFYGLSEANLTVLDTCQNQLCSGFLIQYSIPNETGDGLATREVKKSIRDPQNCDESFCWTTENFDEIQVLEVVMKFTLADLSPVGLNLTTRSLTHMEAYDAEPALFFSFQEWMQQDTAYVGNIASTVFTDNGYWAQPLFVQQSDEFYPSFDNYTYIEVIPSFETQEQETFIIEYDYGETLLFQPFTGIRGGLVNDSLRHNVILDFTLPLMCFSFIVDLKIPDNTTFRFSSGSLEFAHAHSCFMFMDGGRFEVGANEKMIYGINGIGAIALAREGHIFLEEKSELVVSNKMVLVAYSGGPSEKAYVHLAPGSRLVFDEHASLSRTLGDHMFLYVYMNGGELDDSNLSEEERSLIRRIYPSTENYSKHGELTFYPNPIREGSTVITLDQEYTQPIPYQLLDARGRIQDSGMLIPTYGNQSDYTPPADLASGMYILNLHQVANPTFGRLLIQK